MYWADLHNHNEIGYGKGTLERSYALAENTLDVYAFSPHGFWTDPPASDPKMAAYHMEAIDRISAAYPRVVEAAAKHYRPGEFVTFVAYEWHSIQWGDYVVLFPGAEGTLHRARDLDDLQSFARRHGALLIPHHVAYRHGWRGLDWNLRDAELSPLVEVFSEHGNSMERDGLWPMHPHSMGGVSASQTAEAQMRRGCHFGLTAGTDNHYGYPANYGEGITGILAPELTREAVFDALRRRHTCAATGDRIELSVRSGAAIMGDALPAGAPREFEIEAYPLDPLDTVQIIRNGEPVHVFPAPPRAEKLRAGRCLVRLDWGWGRMGHAEPAEWRTEVALRGGKLLRHVPCFCGGPDVGRVNLVTATGPQGLSLQSFTSRHNSRPVNGIVLEIEGEPDTHVSVSAKVDVEGDTGACDVASDLQGLYQDDTWGMPLMRFSSPRLRLGQAHMAENLAFCTDWRDSSPSERDLYVVKAQQRNGQIAWSSPILFADG